MEKLPIIVAVDGFSSCGKSTMAKALAKEIGYIYVDSGAMYRAVTFYALRHRLIQEEGILEEALQQAIEGDEITISFKLNAERGGADTYLNSANVEQEIRSMEVSDKVSLVSALSFVRQFLVRQQQALGKERGIVMDGRDIGTVVFPQAELKVFVTASAQTRAQRRVDELTRKGVAVSFDEVLANVEKRDHIDQTRADSPLRRADDALLLDNSHLTLEEQNEWMIARFNEAIHK